MFNYKVYLYLFQFSACSAGNYYNLTMEVCKVCPLNSYQNLEAATSCLPCPKNRITPKTGATSLTECISPLGMCRNSVEK
jgi:hypothetical protein